MDASPLQVTRKKIENKVDAFAILPDDLLIEIFKNLPPYLLHYTGKSVCRRWFILITNSTLLDRTSLILQKPTASHTVRFMHITEEIQNPKIKEECINIPYSGRIKSWCKEYLLIADQNKPGSLYMFNLITKKRSLFPACSISCGRHYGWKCGVGLSYDEVKGVYKIVHVVMGPPIQCELLVVKSNIKRYNRSKWKKVNGPDYMGQRKYFWDDPVSVQGRYLHWDVYCPKYLVSMDTVKETFHQICLPGSDIINNRYSLVEMGGFLAVIRTSGVGQVNIWMLKDFQKTKWEKLCSVSTSSFVISPGCGSNVIFPVSSVISKRYIIFKRHGPQTGLYRYDLKNKIMKRLEIDIQGDERFVVHSVTSSVW